MLRSPGGIFFRRGFFIWVCPSRSGFALLLRLYAPKHKVHGNYDQRRSDDIVMRLGGDEFAIFMPTVTEKASAESFFARLFDNIKSIQIPELGPRPIVVSLGACLYDGKETANFDMLYRRADHAMYQSKKQPGLIATIYGEI